MRRFALVCLGSVAATAGLAVAPLAASESVASRAAPAVTTASATSPSFVVAVEGLDGALWVNENGTGWQSLGGQIIAPPAVAELTDSSGDGTGQPLFIAEGTNGELWMRSMTVGWQPLGGVPCYTGGPAVLTVNIQTYVACSGIYHYLEGSSTTVFTPSTGLPQLYGFLTSLGGILSAAPAMSVVAGEVTYFVRGINGQIWLNTGTAGSFSPTPWFCVGAPAAAAPLNAAGSDTFFACQGLDHTVWEASNAGSGWTAAASLGGQLIGGPAIAASTSGTLFFAEGLNGSVYERTLSSGWVSLGGQAVGGVGAAALS